MTFVKRQHVLLRLMFLLVLIFFSLFAASSSFFFFFFPEFDFLHFSFTLGCFIPVCNVCMP